MSTHQGGERFTVELQALPDEVPPAVRLKRWLKGALRSARFRALSVKDSTPALPPAEGQGNADGAGGTASR
jgi:hypothetical protein